MHACMWSVNVFLFIELKPYILKNCGACRLYVCMCMQYVYTGGYITTQSDFSDRAPAHVETYYDSKSDFSLYIHYILVSHVCHMMQLHFN